MARRFLALYTEIPYDQQVQDDELDLRFSWDPNKAAENLRKHGISFEEGTYVFDDPHILEEDDVFSQGEYRMIAIGSIDEIIITVVYAVPEEMHFRIISARQAIPEERRTYERSLFHP